MEISRLASGAHCWLAGCLLLLSPLSFLSGEPPTYFVPSGSIQVAIEPASAAGSTQWQFLTERDAGGKWVIRPEAWIAAHQTVGGFPPGRYAIACRGSVGYSDPDITEITVGPVADLTVPIRLTALPVFATIADITPQTIRHGETLKFLLQESASVSFDPHHTVDRNIQFEYGVFSYAPLPEEREQFTVTFNGGATTNAVVFTPVSILPSEHSAIEYQGDFPFPESAERKQFLTVTSEASAAARDFNYRMQKVRTVTISGPRLVFQRGHEQMLFEQFCYAQNSNDDIEAIDLYADQVVIRERAHFPSTNVRIWARELLFEGEGAIVTTPLELSSPPSNQINPIDIGGLKYNESGKAGLPAGSITLHVSAVVAPDGAARLVLKGGGGQSGEDGVEGAPLTNPDRQVFTFWNLEPMGRVIRYWWDCTWQCICDDVVGGATSSFYTNANVCARSGVDAVGDGASGNGGNGGRLSAPFTLEGITDVQTGSPGRQSRNRWGSPGDYPANAVFVKRETEGLFCSWSGTWIYLNCNNRDGVHTPSLPPVGNAPVSGILATDLPPFAWLHPVGVRAVLEYARQAYLNGYPEEARQILEPYAVALAAAVQLPEQWSDDAETLQASSLAQVRNEVVDVLSRIDQHLDYFGYPAGWVPMLSFEVMRQIFEDEVKLAGDILYVTWYLGQAAGATTNKVAAILRLRNEMSSEFDDLGSDLRDTQEDIGALKLRADALDLSIRHLAQEMKLREDELREKAKLTLGLKKAFSIAGTVLRRWPVGQPIAGLLGAGLTSASKFNEQDALQSAIDGTNLASEVVQSTIDQNLEDFQTFTGAGDPRLGAAFLVGQKSLQAFDAGLVGINQVLTSVQSWNTDLDREVQVLAAEDPIHKDLVQKLVELNKTRRQFAEDLAGLMQQSKDQMDRMTQISLALHNLSRDLGTSGEKIDQEAFRYIRELEQRQKDRLLKYQYYLLKAYHYRTLRGYQEVSGDAFNLQAVFDHFQDHFTDVVPVDAGAPILPRNPPDGRDLMVIFREQLQAIRSAIVERLNENPPEKTTEIKLALRPEMLAFLNSWDDTQGGVGRPLGYPLRLNLVDLGIFDPNHENLRIYKLWVEELEASPISGHTASDMTLTIGHSGESLVDFEGNSYKFVHYKTVSGRRMSWGARYHGSSGGFTNDDNSEASDSLLASLLGQSETYDMLTYSRPGAWADLVISKATPSDPGAMRITKLTLAFKVDYQRKTATQEDLQIQAVSTLGQPLTPYIVVRTADKNSRADGFGEFRRVYTAARSVILEAPMVHGANTFDRWEDIVGETIGTDLAVTVLPGKYRAVYRSAGEGRFRRGDSNNDGLLDISDAVATLGYLFLGSPSTLDCLKTADTDDNGYLEITDPVVLLNYLFLGGPAPPEPFAGCGTDPTPDGLTCGTYAWCP